MVGSVALPALKAVATTTPLIVTVDAGGVTGAVGAVSLPPQALSAAAAMAVSASVFDKGAYFMLGVISILKCSWGAGQGARWPSATANGEDHDGRALEAAAFLQTFMTGQ